MKHVIEGFSVMFVLVLNLFLCTGMLGAAAKVAAAKEYKAAVVSEVENSNFNPRVVEACIQEAKEHGYVLEITDCQYKENSGRAMAEVRLTYQYEIPILGVTEQKMTRGIAR